MTTTPIKLLQDSKHHIEVRLKSALDSQAFIRKSLLEKSDLIEALKGDLVKTNDAIKTLGGSE